MPRPSPAQNSIWPAMDRLANPLVMRASRMSLSESLTGWLILEGSKMLPMVKMGGKRTRFASQLARVQAAWIKVSLLKSAENSRGVSDRCVVVELSPSPSSGDRQFSLSLVESLGSIS